MSNPNTPDVVDRLPAETEFGRDLTRGGNHLLATLFLIEKSDAMGAVSERVLPLIAALRAAVHVGVQGVAHDQRLYRPEVVVERWLEHHRRPVQTVLREAGKVEEALDVDLQSAKHNAMKPILPDDMASLLTLELRRGEVRRALAALPAGEAQLRLRAAADSGADRDVLDSWLTRPSLSALPSDVTTPTFIADITRRVHERITGFQSPTAAALDFTRQIIRVGEAVARIGTPDETPARPMSSTLRG